MSGHANEPTLRAPGFPEQEVRRRARAGAAAIFPDVADYGVAVFGGGPIVPRDGIDAYRLVPPVFMPRRLEKLIELGREPLHEDVALASSFGGFDAPLPLYLSALGSTRVAAAGCALAAQAGRIGLPMVIGENVAPVSGFRAAEEEHHALLERMGAYTATLSEGTGGVVVQQSTEDANAEVWNNVYTDPAALELMESRRLAFELKVGQGAKPGLGGLTMVDEETSTRLAEQYAMEQFRPGDPVLRCSSPGTFTPEVLRQQIHLMRNNYPRARCWVKLPPGRDVAKAAAVAWQAGANAVTVDGAQGGTGWAPSAFLDQVGLPLHECLRRIGRPAGTLLVSGRVHDGARTVKVLALGAQAVGLGRAALIAVDEDRENGLVRFVESIALEMRLLISALGKYAVDEPDPDDLWGPADAAHETPVRHDKGKALA